MMKITFKSKTVHMNNQGGFSLLEVLISLFVLAVGLLGLLALQMNSMQSNHSALYRTSATIFAYDMFDRIRLNKAADYRLAATAATPTGNTWRDQDLKAWRENISSVLPNGNGAVVYQGNNIVTVSVYWNDSRAGGANAQSFTVSSEP